jgi:putative transcriptional regulator
VVPQRSEPISRRSKAAEAPKVEHVSSDFDTLRGQVLVAAPSLVDPNFRRTVVLVTEHNEEGAMGVVLNRATPVAVSEAVPHLGELAGEGAVVFVGGPVQPEAVVALAEFDDPSQAASIAFEGVGYVRAEAEPTELDGVVGRLRVFAGYAGWAAGQLDAELEESAWIVEPALADDVFCADPADLWSAVLRRKGGPYAFLATIPPDPALN